MSRISHGAGLGRLGLTFELAHGRTALGSRLYTWPFSVGRVFREDDLPGGAVVIVQSVSGTINAGDHVRHDIAVASGGRARVRGQGAVSVHRALDGRGSSEDIRLVVGARGRIENLSEPRLLFPGADHAQSITLDVAAGGAALHVDAFVALEPDGEQDRVGRYRSRTEVVRDGALRAREVVEIALPLPVAFGRHPAHAVVVLAVDAVPSPDTWAQWLAEVSTEGTYGAVSVLPNGAGVSARIAAIDGRLLRAAIDSVVALFRATAEGSRV